MRTIIIDGVECEVPDDTPLELVDEVVRWWEERGLVSFIRMDNAGIRIPQALKDKHTLPFWGSAIYEMGVDWGVDDEGDE